MIDKPARGLFITGNDTEVGKTWVASIIVRSLVAAGYRVGVYKPVASDCVFDGRTLVSEDAIALWNAAGAPMTLDHVCPQRFRVPLAPHLAARNEGREVSSQQLRDGLSAWSGHCDLVVIEGAGGLMSPISDDEYVADLALEFGYPLVVVAANMLGAINQTLQTLVTAASFRTGLPVAGIVMNDLRQLESDVSSESNPREIAIRSLAPVLGRVRYESDQLDQPVDWFALAGPVASRSNHRVPLR
jgi:dethiobiotin synthetase